MWTTDLATDLKLWRTLVLGCPYNSCTQDLTLLKEEEKSSAFFALSESHSFKK